MIQTGESVGKVPVENNKPPKGGRKKVKMMIVTNGDMTLCEECYWEDLCEQDPATHFFSATPRGVCDSCGKIEETQMWIRCPDCGTIEFRNTDDNCPCGGRFTEPSSKEEADAAWDYANQVAMWSTPSVESLDGWDEDPNT